MPWGLPAIASRSGEAGRHLCNLYAAYRTFIKLKSKWRGKEMQFLMTVPFVRPFSGKVGQKMKEFAFL
jgi:hypothetical protein